MGIIIMLNPTSISILLRKASRAMKSPSKRLLKPRMRWGLLSLSLLLFFLQTVAAASGLTLNNDDQTNNNVRVATSSPSTNTGQSSNQPAPVLSEQRDSENGFPALRPTGPVTNPPPQAPAAGDQADQKVEAEEPAPLHEASTDPSNPASNGPTNDPAKNDPSKNPVVNPSADIEPCAFVNMEYFNKLSVAKQAALKELNDARTIIPTAKIAYGNCPDCVGAGKSADGNDCGVCTGTGKRDPLSDKSDKFPTKFLVSADDEVKLKYEHAIKEVDNLLQLVNIKKDKLMQKIEQSQEDKKAEAKKNADLYTDLKEYEDKAYTNNNAAHSCTDENFDVLEKTIKNYKTANNAESEKRHKETYDAAIGEAAKHAEGKILEATDLINKKTDSLEDKQKQNEKNHEDFVKGVYKNGIEHLTTRID